MEAPDPRAFPVQCREMQILEQARDGDVHRFEHRIRDASNLHDVRRDQVTAEAVESGLRQELARRLLERGVNGVVAHREHTGSFLRPPPCDRAVGRIHRHVGAGGRGAGKVVSGDAEGGIVAGALTRPALNGLPVYDSLALSTRTLDNAVLRKQLEAASKDIVNQGAALSASLKKVKIFPNFAINMIAVGEEGGKLEESLDGVAEAYEKEVEQAIGIMTSLIEPLLILTIGGIVGCIVFAMLLPIFDIGSGAH